MNIYCINEQRDDFKNFITELHEAYFGGGGCVTTLGKNFTKWAMKQR